MIAGRSNRKSFGRFRRSVEMMTHRPVTGSLRSSGMKGVLIYLDDRPPIVELNRNESKTAGRVVEMMPHPVCRRQPDDSLPLLPGDRFGRIAERAAVARLHL